MENYDKLISVDPNCIDAHINKAFLFENKKFSSRDLDKSMESLTSAKNIEHSTDRNQSYSYQAIRLFDKIIQTDPEYANVYYHKALLQSCKKYWKMDLAQARLNYEKCLKKDLNHKEC